MRVAIYRAKSGPYGTFGILCVEGAAGNEIPTCVTLEPSEPIPAGTYRATSYQSPKFGHEVYLLHDVPGHDGVEIHIGNTWRDTKLCILVGESFGPIKLTPGIRNSGPTFWRLMRKFDGNEITVEIR